MREAGTVQTARRSLRALAVVVIIAAGAGCDGAPAPTVDRYAPSPVSTGPSGASPSRPAPSTTATEPATPPNAPGPIEHPSGATFLRPAGWQETGATIGSAFAADADCRAAIIVDREPPADSGPAPSVDQSVVQVCAQPSDDRSLEAYLATTYGTGLPGFAPTTLGGLDAYRSVDGTSQLIFVQTDRARFQIATSVETEPALEAERTRQITSILDSFDFS